MGYMRCLLVLSLGFAVSYSLEARPNCPNLDDDPTEFNDEIFDQVNRTGNLRRFCQRRAYEIRQQHFWCLGYIGENNMEVENSAIVSFPEDDPEDDMTSFWSIFLQYPVLSWMDVGRKQRIMNITRILASSGTDPLCDSVTPFEDLCVSNVGTYDVAEYSESVLITLYNLGPGIDGDIFNECFNEGLRELANSEYLVRFRGRRAFKITLNDVNLMEMFDMNIGPASSLNDESRDPTLRPILLGSWPGALTVREARDRVSRSDFGSNPDPINYGLEPGDIVFAFFGSVLLVTLGFLIVLGFFIHPFFLS